MSVSPCVHCDVPMQLDAVEIASIKIGPKIPCVLGVGQKAQSALKGPKILWSHPLTMNKSSCVQVQALDYLLRVHD